VTGKVIVVAVGTGDGVSDALVDAAGVLEDTAGVLGDLDEQATPTSARTPMSAHEETSRRCM
jgi:hypothetical protein